MKKITTLYYLLAGLCILFFVVACPPNAPPSVGWIDVHNDMDEAYYIVIYEETKIADPGGTVTYTVTFASGETSKNVDVFYGTSLEQALSYGSVEAKKGQTVEFFINGF